MMNTSTDAHRNVLRYDQLEREAASDRPFLLPLVTRVGNEADLQDRVLELASRATWLVAQHLPMTVSDPVSWAEQSNGQCTFSDLVYATITTYLHQGFRAMKLRFGYGPREGPAGMRRNVALVRTVREVIGDDVDLMADAYMGWDVAYCTRILPLLEPYRLRWIEEPVIPDDLEGYARVKELANSRGILISGGEHEYTRYGFRLLLEHHAADIWQPDITWCGGLSELRHIGALAAAYNIPVIPHAGWQHGAAHFILATPNSPWCEMFMPPPGGPPEVYRQFEEDNSITRGPEGIYMRPPDRPGFGWELLVD